MAMVNISGHANVIWNSALALFFTFLAVTNARAQIAVIDMTPPNFNDEVNNDTEPNIAVNPNSPLMIAATAFTTFPGCGNKVPIYYSSDGGDNWQFRCILPPSAPNTCPGTCDVTLRFSGPRKQPAEGHALYIGMLNADQDFNFNLIILRSVDLLSATTIASRSAAFPNIPDQPYIQAATARAANAPNDRIYVGLNDLEVGIPPASATVDASQDGSVAQPSFTSSRIETLKPCQQDAPSVRPAAHPDGTVYAVFLRWTKCDSMPFIGDVVAVRDDNWGSSRKAFTDLKDANGRVGVNVASGVSFPFNSKLGGTQRIGSQLSIALNSANSKMLYVAWADGTDPSKYTIHVVKTQDRGTTWSKDLLTVASATNPAIAVDEKGDVGILYQRYVVGDRWETHLVITRTDFTLSKDIVLANVPNALAIGGAGPLGDYDDLTAVGATFYGVFAAYNFPDQHNFPNGVRYLRKVSFNPPALLKDDGATKVASSIDPFFFRVNAAKLSLDKTK